jgi:hypothetical protein
MQLQNARSETSRACGPAANRPEFLAWQEPEQVNVVTQALRIAQTLGTEPSHTSHSTEHRCLLYRIQEATERNDQILVAQKGRFLDLSKSGNRFTTRWVLSDGRWIGNRLLNTSFVRLIFTLKVLSAIPSHSFRKAYSEKRRSPIGIVTFLKACSSSPPPVQSSSARIWHFPIFPPAHID